MFICFEDSIRSDNPSTDDNSLLKPTKLSTLVDIISITVDINIDGWDVVVAVEYIEYIYTLWMWTKTEKTPWRDHHNFGNIFVSFISCYTFGLNQTYFCLKFFYIFRFKRWLHLQWGKKRDGLVFNGWLECSLISTFKTKHFSILFFCSYFFLFLC